MQNFNIIGVLHRKKMVIVKNFSSISNKNKHLCTKEKGIKTT